MKGIPLPLIFMAILALIILITAIFLARFAYRREKAIRQDGIYADSVVVKCVSHLDDGKRRHTTIVRFTGNDGKEHECALNYAGAMPIGRKVKIQYLPNKFDYVIFISQEL